MVFRGWLVPWDTLMVEYDDMGGLVDPLVNTHVYARRLRLGKRHVMRFYREASNGTFPVTVVMKEVG